MTPKTIIRRAAVTAALLLGIGVSVAYAHGNADQVNDPATDSGWYCAAEGADHLYQGFLPTRRLLASFDARVFRRLNFPAGGMTLRGAVHAATGTGSVLGTASAVVPEGDEDSVMVHFDFSPPVTLEPEGTFVFELSHDVSGVRWMGRNDNPYTRATSFDCGGGMPDSQIDFNFISYAAPDGGPPETVLSGGRNVASVTRRRALTISFAGSDDASYASSLLFACELDREAYTPCSSPVSLTGLLDGVHGFTVRAIDQAGQADASPSLVSWTVDGTAPSRPSIKGPRRVKTGRAAYRFSARDGIDRSRQLKFRCALDGRQLSACGTRIVRVLSKGRHVLRVVAVDRAGNLSRPATVTIVRV
jgi:hypothetical protein